MHRAGLSESWGPFLCPEGSEPPLGQARVLGTCPAPPSLSSTRYLKDYFLIKVSLSPCHLSQAPGCSAIQEASPFSPSRPLVPRRAQQDNLSRCFWVGASQWLLVWGRGPRQR